MDTKVAVISILVEDRSAAGTLNQVLHEYGEEIIGRMGLPYPKKGISIISVAVDASPERIQSLLHALTAIPGVKAEAVCSSL